MSQWLKYNAMCKVHHGSNACREVGVSTDSSCSDESAKYDTSDDEYFSVFEEPIEDNATLDTAHQPIEAVKELGSQLLFEIAQLPIEFSPPATASAHDKRHWSPVLSAQSVKRRQSPCAVGRSDEQEPGQDTDLDDDDTVVVYEVIRPLTPPAVHFACPFAVRFPWKHHSCFVHYKLRDMRALSHHIWAVHRRPHSCPICRTTFATAAQRDEHVGYRTCALQTTPIIEGVTRQQIQIIERQRKCENSPERQNEQWLTTYAILFPRHPRPATGYVPKSVAAVVHKLQWFWDDRGYQAMSKLFKSRSPGKSGAASDDKSKVAFQRAVLEYMVDQMLGPKWWAHNSDIAHSGGQQGTVMSERCIHHPS